MTALVAAPSVHFNANDTPNIPRPSSFDGIVKTIEYDWDFLYASHQNVEPPVSDPKDRSAESWIKRSPVLIRHTGKHPFNCEPPQNKLMQYGFITPASIHYVRNHGPVPRGDWSTWTVEVTGLVKHPYKFTMDELVSDFEPIEIPVTLACSGNRRKEVNMVRQTSGFNWGPGATSTSVWRGARLYDILKKCGIMSRKAGALYVCFEGAEDLAAPGVSSYGTSVTREMALDPSRDIMLAYMQNGDYIIPDHGFPVRVIVPGFTGGRSVKWVKRITVTTKESDSYYHFKDNRLLPTHVDTERATAEGWWNKPEFIIYELNINSVITTPAHDEVIPVNSLTMQRSYTMRGYAYSGGGRKVTRVEITLDGGETWIVCTLNHPEKPTKYGKYWCWCFWYVKIELLALLSASEVAVRAWDESNNSQPEKVIWNVLGMFNNAWYRIRLNINHSDEGELGLMFEHPIVAGGSGGWMAHNKEVTKTIAKVPSIKASTSAPPASMSNVQYTMDEVSEHTTRESAWLVINEHVYDATSYIKDHPGGADSILINAGTDCTEEFDSIHSDGAKEILKKFKIGELTTTKQSIQKAPSTINRPIQDVPTSQMNPRALANPREKVKCTLVAKTVISRDTRIFRFALPSSDQVLGLPVGKHIFLSATVGGKLCLRAYTPSSHVDVKGHFELVIKVYFKGENAKYPDGGVMSQYLESLSLGATIDIKGPLGEIEYIGRGNFTVKGEPCFAKRLAMIAGGTGITPIYQVMQAILRDQPNDITEMHLVYANRSEDDILLRQELDNWAAMHPDRLKVWYVVSEVKHPELEWKYSTGYINENILRDHVPLGAAETLALICGPPPMIKQAVLPNLEKMGYNVDKSCLLF
ncbi:Nitrate reductase [Rhynchospora pubera]|uniref:Nitrate reductase n=1 Tax=Rhynchospora pubera TaxID=906938 RepID=A0AAV8CCZ2_9POAL|nr:Nitrate reductase [Rhynchospora pubera]KAJ4817652.1 Nitrate reductase [Rhynchospora pubera]